MVFMMGCLARDNNDNNDANALYYRPRRGEGGYTKKSKIRGVPERDERWWLKAKKEGKDEGKVVWGKDGKLANWVIPRPNSSSCSLPERRRKYYFASIGVPLRPLPPPSAPFLRFSLSLIESSNFRLHSPSACLLCRVVRIQRTLCRNLGTRTRWRVHSSDADRRLERGERKRETKRKRGKNKESERNVELSYSYRDWEKSSLRKCERLAPLRIGKKFRRSWSIFLKDDSGQAKTNLQQCSCRHNRHSGKCIPTHANFSIHLNSNIVLQRKKQCRILKLIKTYTYIKIYRLFTC